MCDIDTSHDYRKNVTICISHVGGLAQNQKFRLVISNRPTVGFTRNQPGWEHS